MAAALKFKNKNADGDWISTCGRYHIWVQESPREEGNLYAAARADRRFPSSDGVKRAEWLCDLAGSFREAKEACAADLVHETQRSIMKGR